MSALEAEVRTALQQVFDPCSVAARSPLSIIDMGLVVRIQADDGAIEVTLRPTSRGCTLIPSIMQAAEDSVRAVPGVRTVTINLDTESFWTHADISAAGQQILAERREQSRQQVPIHPQQWKLRVQQHGPVAHTDRQS